MSEKNFPEVIKEIHHKDDRFAKGAYYFIREALDHTLKNLEKANSKNKGHVSGTELLNGIRDYALDRFGPMTMTLMEHWNISKCRDFGDIVFNLVDHGILGRTENDTSKILKVVIPLKKRSNFLFYQRTHKEPKVQN